MARGQNGKAAKQQLPPCRLAILPLGPSLNFTLDAIR